MKDVKEKESSSRRDGAGFLSFIFLRVLMSCRTKVGRQVGTTAAAAATRIPDGDTRNDTL